MDVSQSNRTTEPTQPTRPTRTVRQARRAGEPVRRRAGVVTVAGVLALTAAPAPAAATAGGSPVGAAPPAGGTVSLVSVGPDGVQGDRPSWLQQQVPSLSANGDVVVFTSMASTLVPGDTNEAEDVFAHDRRTGQTVRVSVSSDGTQAAGGSTDASVSADGRFVVFTSGAADLVPGDTNDVPDVFLHDLDTGTTTRVSVGACRRQGNGPSYFPTISADASTVAFQTQATNLGVGRKARDTNEQEDVYVRDLRRGTTTRVSLTPDGGEFTGPSAMPALSADGQQVAFVAEHGGSNRFEVWLHDRSTRTTRLVSVDGDTGQDDSVGRPSMSADGRFVAFDTARPLVPEDSGTSRDVYVRDMTGGGFTRVSVGVGGAEADADSGGPSMSADGRFVAFSSAASNLVPGDVGGLTDVFLADTLTGEVRLVSRSDAGEQGDWHSAYFSELSVSPDGASVAFESGARNLVPGDANELPDVFVWSATAGS